MSRWKTVLFRLRGPSARALAAGAAFAFGAEARAASEVEQVKELLKAQYAPYVDTLSNDAYVYHWASGKEIHGKSLINFSGTSEEDAVAHFRRWAGSYFDAKPYHYSMMWGYGYYAAHDPSSSSDYGNKLTRVLLPKGMAYLDMRRSGSLPMGDALLASKAFRALCPSTRDGFSVREKFDATPSCLEAFRTAWVELKIGFIAYTWTYGIAANIVLEPLFADSDIALIPRRDFDAEKERYRSGRVPRLDAAVPPASELWEVARQKAKEADAAVAAKQAELGIP